MAYENAVLDMSFPAEEDLSSDQYRLVVLGTTGIRRPDTAAEVCIGILQNAPVSGAAAVVRIFGVSKLVVNAALAIGSFVKQEYVSATDAGKGEVNTAAPTYTRALVIGASGAEDDLATVLLTSPFPAINDAVASIAAVATVTTAGAATYTAANLVGGLILRDPAGADRSDVTPTAALIIAAIPGAIVTSSLMFTIRNSADADETITLTAGVGVTLNGTMTIAANSSRRFLCVVTGAAAVTIYNMDETATLGKSTVTTLTTADVETYTAAQLLGGLILRDPAGGARADLTATAPQIIAAMPGAMVKTSFEFTIRNTADANETITLTAPDASVTISGTATIAQNNTKRFLCVVTGAATVTIYSLGTIVH